MNSLKDYANTSPDDQVMFLITEEDVQTVALLLTERRLTEDELRIARKGIEAGLSCGLEVIVNTAIEEALNGG